MVGLDPPCAGNGMTMVGQDPPYAGYDAYFLFCLIIKNVGHKCPTCQMRFQTASA